MLSCFKQQKTNFLTTLVLILVPFCIVVVTAGFLLSPEQTAYSDSNTPPAVINYQGKLLNNGASVTTSKQMGFVIYDAKTGGNKLYTASGTLANTSTINVSVDKGIFNVELGDSNTNNLDKSIFKDNQTLYLQVYIEGTKLTPRKQLTSQPFALNSQYLMGHIATSSPTSTGYVPISDSSGDFTFQGATISNTENNASSALKIKENGSTKFNFLSGGQFGINRSSPSHSLSVKGDADITGTTTLGTLGGNVGIGENNPSKALQVSGGDIKAASEGYNISAGSVNSGLQIAGKGTTPHGLIFNDTGSKLYVTGLDNDKIYEYNLSTDYDVTTANFNDSLDISGIDTTPRAINFNDDGSKFYIVGNNSDRVYEYGLTTNYDISTGSLNDSLNFQPKLTFGVGMAFNSDGSKLFLANNKDSSIYEYDLSGNQYDVSEASFTDKLDVSSEDDFITGIDFNGDGSKFFVVGGINDNIYEYDLSGDKYDVSEASFTDSFDISSESKKPRGFKFNGDGSKFFVVDPASDEMYEYDLSGNQYDINKASYSGNKGFFAGNDSKPRGMAFNDTGSRLYVVGNQKDYIYEFKLSTDYDVSTASFLDNLDISDQDTHPVGMRFNDNGSKLYMIGSANDNIYEYDLSSNKYDISKASFTDKLDISTEDTSPTAMEFNTSGTKLYITGDSNDKIFEYDLSGNKFDIDKATSADSLGVSSEDDTPKGMSFNDDGSKLYMIGSQNNKVYEYDLSGNKFDIDKATLTDSFDFSSRDNFPSSMDFNSDGSNMYIVGNGSNNNVYEYDLSSNKYDVSESSFTDKLDLKGQDGIPRDIDFDSDGSKMYVVGDENDKVYEYDMSTKFDLSSASFKDSLDVSPKSKFPDGMSFNSDGSKLYITSRSNGKVFEYDLSGNKYDISEASSTDELDVSSRVDTLSGITFNSDGSKLFLTGSGSKIFEYDLSGNKFDVSEAKFIDSLDISSQISTPTDIVFSGDGSKLYISESTSSTNKINEYHLSIDYDISTAEFHDNLDVSSNPGGPLGISFNNDGSKLFEARNYNGTFQDKLREYTIPSSGGSITLGGDADISGTATTSDLIAQNSITLSGDQRSSWSDIVTSFGGWATSTGTIFTNNTSSQVVVGSQTTSTAENILEVSGSGYISTKLGIGTTTPNNTLDVMGTSSISGRLQLIDNSSTLSNTSSFKQNTLSIIGPNNTTGTIGIQGPGTNTNNYGGTINFGDRNTSTGKAYTYLQEYRDNELFVGTGAGNDSNDNNTHGLAIGDGSGPFTAEAELHVQGSACITDDETCSKTLQEGEIGASSTIVTGADVAERYESPQQLNSGELVQISNSSSRKEVTRTDSKYDDKLIGVVSTNPGIVVGDNTATNTYSIAISGRVPTLVSSAGGNIDIGDPITASSDNGVGMKATSSAHTIGRALESFNGTGTTTISIYINPEYNYANQEFAVTDSGQVGIGTTTPDEKLTVAGGISADSLFINSSTSSTIGKLKISSSGDLITANQNKGFIFDTQKQLNTNSSTYLASFRNQGKPIMSIATNGDLHTEGTVYADSFNTGENNPGDLAEEVALVGNQSVEPGDVLAAAKEESDTYRKTTKAYSASVAGVVSPNPSITIGGSNSTNTAVMAVTGRVPVKVIATSGTIHRGDLLVSAKKDGYAQKYNPGNTSEDKVVASVGIALEEFSGKSNTSTKIMTLVQSGWVSNYQNSLQKIKKNIDTIARVEGLNLNKNTKELTVTNKQGKIRFEDNQNLNLSGGEIVNVESIHGQNNNWEIDSSGRLVTKVETSQGEKSLYNIKSEEKPYYTFFGSSKLEQGEKRVEFKQYRQDIIDSEGSIRVNLTLNAPAEGVYVSEKSSSGFTVKELNNGTSTAGFDWTVIAKRATGTTTKEDVTNVSSTDSNSNSINTTSQTKQESEQEEGDIDEIQKENKTKENNNSISEQKQKHTNEHNTTTSSSISSTSDINSTTTSTAESTTTESHSSDSIAQSNNEIKNPTSSSSNENADNTAPSISLKGDKTIEVVKNKEYSDPGYTAVDDTDGDLTSEVQTASNVDTSQIGKYKIEYKVSDAAGNKAKSERVVKVIPPEDNTKPEISLLGDKKITQRVGEKYTDPGANAVDNRDGKISSKIEVNSTVNTKKAGKYEVSYKVEDKAGNTAQKKRVVIIKESKTNKDIENETDSSENKSSSTKSNTSTSE